MPNYSLRVAGGIFPDEQRGCWEQEQAGEMRAQFEAGILSRAFEFVIHEIAGRARVEHLWVVPGWLDVAQTAERAAQPIRGEPVRPRIFLCPR